MSYPAGNGNALSYTADEQEHNPAFSVHYPHQVDEEILAAAIVAEEGSK